MPSEIRSSSSALADLVSARILAGELSPETESYFLANEGRIKFALLRGFTTPAPPIPGSLEWWIAAADKFSWQTFRWGIKLERSFNIPKLPWQSVIPILDPGSYSTRNAIELLRSQGYQVESELAADDLPNADARGVPTLRFIAREGRPTESTLGLSAKAILKMPGRFLGLRGYLLALTLQKACLGSSLNLCVGMTLFPHDRTVSGKVVYAKADMGSVQIGLTSMDSTHPQMGARFMVKATAATPVVATAQPATGMLTQLAPKH